MQTSTATNYLKDLTQSLPVVGYFQAKDRNICQKHLRRAKNMRRVSHAIDMGNEIIPLSYGNCGTSVKDRPTVIDVFLTTMTLHLVKEATVN